MTRPASYLGIDLGTSGLKVALVREDGQVVVEGEAAYQVLSPRARWAETDPAVWWAALGQVVEGMAEHLQTHQVNGIGLAGQMHGVVLCDRAGTPLRPAILWPDRRSQHQLSRWRELSAADRARLSNPIVPGMFGPILSWLVDNEASAVELLPAAPATAGGSVCLTGGGGREPALQQLLADVLVREVHGWRSAARRRPGPRCWRHEAPVGPRAGPSHRTGGHPAAGRRPRGGLRALAEPGPCRRRLTALRRR